MLRLLILASSLMAISLPTAAQAETDLEAKNREFIVKNYPPGALKRGEQGRVAFRITIEPDGSLGQCEVTESSGFVGLDNETCEIMIFNARLKPVRDESGRAVRSSQNGFIVWRLPEGSTSLATSTAASMPKPDKIFCKRTPKVGSLVAMTKQCMTKEEWMRTEQATREQVDNIMFRGHCDARSCGPGE